MNTELVHFDRARHELAEAHRIDEVKQIRDKAEALRQYIRQQGASLEMQNQAAEIKLRAERRAGEILKEMERAKPEDNLFRGNIVQPREARNLEELGISKIQSHRWQLEASVPEVEFEQYIAEIKDRGEELTSVGLRRLALKGKYTFQQNNIEIPFPEGKYRTITIDPPWPIEKIQRDIRPDQLELDYRTMTIDEIKLLPIPDIAFADGSHIYLWTTHKYLPTAFDVFKAWNVNYECLLTWVKNVGFTPFSWMYSTEHCLFGRIGTLSLLKLGKRLDFEAKVREHSRKPDEFYKLIVEVSPEPRIDIFSRENHKGFEQYGDEPKRFS